MRFDATLHQKVATTFLAIFLAAPFAHASRLTDRTTAPSRPSSGVERHTRFAFPPGHVTISRTGRIFMDSLTSDDQSKIRVIELKDGVMSPFPAPELQKKYATIHCLHVDSQDRLWVLDHGSYGFFHHPRLYGYDVNTGKEIVNYSFPPEVAGPGSMLNDVIPDPVRNKLYISDTGPIFGHSGIIIFDITTGTSRRILDSHPTLTASSNDIYVEGEPFTVLGIFHPRFGLDGIAIDPAAKWIYYAAFNRGELYRIPIDAAVNEKLDDRQLEPFIEKVADITMTDGMFVDSQQRVYLTDVEHSAIVRVSSDGRLETVFKDPAFRWPTGFALSPDGWMYFTCDAINQTTLQSRETILGLGPYFLFRFKPY